MFKSFEDVVAFNQANIDAAVQTSTKLTAGIESLTKEYIANATKAFEGAVESAKTVTSAKTPTDVIALQQKLAKDNYEAAVAEATKFQELSTGLVKSAFEPMQARYKAAFETFSKG